MARTAFTWAPRLSRDRIPVKPHTRPHDFQKGQWGSGNATRPGAVALTCTQMAAEQCWMGGPDGVCMKSTPGIHVLAILGFSQEGSP